MTVPLEINLPEFEKWVNDTIYLADQVGTYRVTRPYFGHADLQQSLEYFIGCWEYAIQRQGEDLEEYGPRLKLTKRAYCETDEFVAQDLLNAWNGTY
jgi:hypothetical protein